MSEKEITMQTVVDSLDANLHFVSELLQASIRVFINREAPSSFSPEKVIVHNYFHPNQDSLYIPRTKDLKRGERFQPHKDISVDKAFRLGKPVIGQYGLVINNRRIQEFAYPISLDDQIVAVIAVERDIYLTRDILGQHWDYIADNLIKALKEKIKDRTRFPQIAFGEGAIILRKQAGQNTKTIFSASPLAVNLLSELVERASQLVGRSLDEVLANYHSQYKGKDEALSIESIQEISLRQRTLALRQVMVNSEMTVVLLKDNSEIKIKETLLKEIHHRVKNNLQTVVSLLRLQKRRHPELEESFNEAINRTNSIALVHEFLARSNDIEAIDFGFLVQKMLRELIASFGADHITINFECPKKVYIVSEDATNLAIVLNEILTNSLEHVGSKLARINIKLHSDENHLYLTVEDDGGGFEEGFDYRQSTGLGWGIVKTITEESLKGKLDVENYSTDDIKGLRVSLTLALPMEMLDSK